MSVAAEWTRAHALGAVGGELAAVGTVVNQDHPADLNKASETHCISN